jgi:hypothetical protein
VAAGLLFGSTAFAQTASGDAVAAESSMANPSMLTEAPAPVKAKEVSLVIKNSCERHIMLYAGNKKEVFSGKSQSLGGLGTNTLYLMEGDVVCIMNDPKNIQACSVIKDGLAKVEINKSGNGFVK